MWLDPARTWLGSSGLWLDSAGPQLDPTSCGDVAGLCRDATGRRRGPRRAPEGLVRAFSRASL